jgi:hypothetical protein
MSDQQLKHLIDVLNAMPTAQSPPSVMPYRRMNAISAPPSALAKQLGYVWKQNSQTILVSKTKQEPETLPMDLVNFISEVAYIPQYAAQFQIEQNKSEMKELLFHTCSSLEYQGFNVDELSPSDDARYSATCSQTRIHLDAATKKQAAACFLLDHTSIYRLKTTAWLSLKHLICLTLRICLLFSPPCMLSNCF